MSFFSIVIPTYNRAELLRYTLMSAENQTWKDFEVIVIDDGSTDHTMQVVNTFKRLNLRYVKIINSERGRARNIGIQNAKGHYIVFLDSDDIMLDNHLQTLADAIQQNQELAFIATKYSFLKENGEIVPSDIHDKPAGRYTYTDFLKGNFLACNICVKNLAEPFCWFQEDRKYSIMEDWIFIVQNLRTHTMHLIDRVTVHMRDHSTRSMRSDNSLIIAKRIAALQFIKDTVPITPHEQIELEAYSFYFCAVHCYLDMRRSEALYFLKKSWHLKGPRIEFLLLLIKIILGKHIVNVFKK